MNWFNAFQKAFVRYPAWKILLLIFILFPLIVLASVVVFLSYLFMLLVEKCLEMGHMK